MKRNSVRTRTWALLLVAVLGTSCGEEAESGEPEGTAMPWPPYFIDQPLSPERAKSLTWQYDAEDAPAGLERSAVIKAIQASFGEWAKLSAGVLVTQKTESAPPAFLTLSWHGRNGMDCSFPHWDSGLAHVLREEGKDGGRYLHMNSEAKELTDPKVFASMLRHEFGHVLGLGHTDPASLGVMAPSASKLGTAIDQGAQAGLATLYGAKVSGKTSDRDLVIRNAATGSKVTRTWFALGHPKLRARLLDVDGDDLPEALLWLDQEIGPLLIVHFDSSGRIRKTAGPFVGFTLATRSTRIGRHASGSLLAIHTDSSGRQVASRLRTEIDGRPGDPWPREQGFKTDQDLDGKSPASSQSSTNSKSILASEQGWILQRGA